MERCTHCKLRMAECWICSSETAILTAAEEEEYKILKDCVIYNKSLGCLQAKYTFKKDPAVLIDNEKEAKTCQISQEILQIKNKTHSQYVKQYWDMVERNVVSEVSQSEVLAYTGPINYITHHEVFKSRSLLTPVHLV